METDQHPEEQTIGKFENLHKVTPLSKYLAMMLFVALPFIGGLVGYKLAPEKVVEVERVVEVEKMVEIEKVDETKYVAEENKEFTNVNVALLPDSTSISGWKMYTSEEFGFQLSIPSTFNIAINRSSYDSSVAISFTGAESEMNEVSISFLPNGGFDYGLEEVSWSVVKTQIGELEAEIDIAEKGSFYREFVRFSSSSIPASWNKQMYRIENRSNKNSALDDRIISTFNFTE